MPCEITSLTIALEVNRQQHDVRVIDPVPIATNIANSLKGSKRIYSTSTKLKADGLAVGAKIFK